MYLGDSTEKICAQVPMFSLPAQFFYVLFYGDCNTGNTMLEHPKLSVEEEISLVKYPRRLTNAGLTPVELSLEHSYEKVKKITK